LYAEGHFFHTLPLFRPKSVVDCHSPVFVGVTCLLILHEVTSISKRRYSDGNHRLWRHPLTTALSVKTKPCRTKNRSFFFKIELKPTDLNQCETVTTLRHILSMQSPWERCIPTSLAATVSSSWHISLCN